MGCRNLNLKILVVLWGLTLGAASPTLANDLTAAPLDSTKFTPMPTAPTANAPEPTPQPAPKNRVETPKVNAPAPEMKIMKPPAWMQTELTFDPHRDMMNRILRDIGKPRTSEGFDDDYIGPIEHYTGDDELTEAAFTHGKYCSSGKCDKGLRHQASKLSDLEAAALSKATSGNICTDRLLKAMRKISSTYDRRGPFSGKCALAVRQGLNASGIYKGGGMGNAKDLGPGLNQLGYVNIFTQGKSAKDVPEGAIMVYGKARRAGCRGLGSTYGHVEIKDFGGRYLYDGTAKRPMDKIHGPDCRPLIGVYVPGPKMRCR